jgi:hypothetical protein
VIADRPAACCEVGDGAAVRLVLAVLAVIVLGAAKCGFSGLDAGAMRLAVLLMPLAVAATLAAVWVVRRIGSLRLYTLIWLGLV